jgi:plastocyanin
VAAAVGMAAPAQSATAGKTISLPATDFQFGSKPDATIKTKVGATVVFTWKQGVHNVVSTALPKGLKKINSGAPTAHHAPLKVKLTKKGTYSFTCVPHAQLGMRVTIKVS